MRESPEEIVKEFAKNYNDWLNISKYKRWENALRRGFSEINQIGHYKDLIAKRPFSGVDKSLNRSEMIRYLNLVWMDDAFGGLGRGSLGKGEIPEERFKELYEVTQQMVNMLDKGEPLSKIVESTPPIINGNVTLRAIKLRALAVLTELQSPSLFTVHPFNAIKSFLKLKDASFPDEVPAFQKLLSGMLPESLRSDPVIVYMFPWIVFEQLILKRDVNPRSVYEGGEIKDGKEKPPIQTWWIKSFDVLQNTQLKEGDIGNFLLSRLSPDKKEQFNQTQLPGEHEVILSDYNLEEDLAFHLSLEPEFDEQGKIVTVTFEVKNRIDLTSSVQEILRESNIGGIADLLIDDRTVILMNQSEFYVILQILLGNQREMPEFKSLSELSILPFKIRDKQDVKAVLGVPELALKFKDLINSLDDEEGQMIGIFGRWGRGKTFLTRHIFDSLGIDYRSEKMKKGIYSGYHLVKLHAWKYREVNAFWAYLYECTAEKYYNSTWNKFLGLGKLWRRFKLNKNRLGWKRVFAYAIPFILSFTWWVLPLESKVDLFQYVFGIEGNKWTTIPKTIDVLVGLIPALISGLLFYFNVFPKASKLITALNYKHSFKEELGFQAKVQDELKTLLETWMPNNRIKRNLIRLKLWFLQLRFKLWFIQKRGRPVSERLFDNLNNKRSPYKAIFVVDDLDRCDLENIVPIADALRIILEEEEIIRRSIVLTLVDERILMKAIENKYKEVYDGIKWNHPRVKEYMDKLFITGLKLPELSFKESVEILDTITEGKVQQLAEATITLVDDAEPVEGFDIPEAIVNDDVNDESSEEVNTINEPPDSYETEIKEERKFSGDPLNEIDQNEKFMIEQYIRELIKPTPRQIKIFYYRYLLMKLIDQIPTYGLSRQLGKDIFARYCLERLLLDHNKTEVDLTPGSIEFDRLMKLFPNELDSDTYYKLNSLMDMTIPY